MGVETFWRIDSINIVKMSDTNDLNTQVFYTIYQSNKFKIDFIYIKEKE